MNTYAVLVSYKVERTAFVQAESVAEAKRLAKDPADWFDADDDHRERMDAVTVKRVKLADALEDEKA